MSSLSDLATGAAQLWSSRLGVTVPPELVLAIVGVESHGDTTAVGAAGELGLMQMLPATAQDLGLQDPTLLSTPEVGVYYGTQYLAQQLQRYGGKIPNAVAAYNAGSVRFNADEQFVNQDYVDKVMLRFQQLLTGGSPVVWVGLAAAAGVVLWLASRKG